MKNIAFLLYQLLAECENYTVSFRNWTIFKWFKQIILKMFLYFSNKPSANVTTDNRNINIHTSFNENPTIYIVQPEDRII